MNLALGRKTFVQLSSRQQTAYVTWQHNSPDRQRIKMYGGAFRNAHSRNESSRPGLLLLCERRTLLTLWPLAAVEEPYDSVALPTTRPFIAGK